MATVQGSRGAWHSPTGSAAGQLCGQLQELIFDAGNMYTTSQQWQVRQLQRLLAMPTHCLCCLQALVDVVKSVTHSDTAQEKSTTHQHAARGTALPPLTPSPPGHVMCRMADVCRISHRAVV